MFILYNPYNRTEQGCAGILTLGTKPFSSIEAVKQNVQEIINGITTENQEIVEEETRGFLLSLFSKHQNYSHKLGPDRECKIIYGKNNSYKGKTTHCFYIQHEDGSKEEISYLKCIATVRDEMFAKRVQALNETYEKKGPLVVELISKTLQGFLLSQTQIMQLLTERFPYKKLRIEQQYLYFRMMLELAVKCESTEEQIIGLCIEKFIQIDADIEAGHKAVIITDTQTIEERINVIIISIIP
jgi:hypothetical protein